MNLTTLADRVVRELLVTDHRNAHAATVARVIRVVAVATSTNGAPA